MNLNKERIEITEKEKTALSLLFGLRQKFALEKRKNPQSYSSEELYKLFSELMNKVNKEEIRIYDRETPRDLYINDQVISDAIKRSKIKRYNWNKILGESLTKVILKSRKEGLNVDETYLRIVKNKNLCEFIQHHLTEESKILENLRISVHARYIENNTAEKVKNE